MSLSAAKHFLSLLNDAKRFTIRSVKRQRVCIYLGRDWSALTLVAGCLRPVIRSKAVFDLPQDHHAYSRLHSNLAAIESWLQEHPVRARIDWIIGIDHVRYLVLPWNDRLQDEVFCHALAAAIFAQQFPGSALGFTAYQMRLGPLAYEMPRTAVLIPSEIISLLTKFAARHHCRTGFITTLLGVVWKNSMARLKNASGSLALVEEQRLLRARYEHGRITSIALQPFSHERDGAMTSDDIFVFPPQAGATPNDALKLPDLKADDDARLVYSLCGVM